MEFEELINKVRPRLKILSYKFKRVNSCLDEDDIYQEMCLHLWQRFSFQELNDKNISYVVQSCVYYINNLLRKKAASKTALLSLEEEHGQEDDALMLKELIADKDALTAEAADVNIFIESVKNDGLTKREKEVFNLCLENLTLRDIAKRLGISHVRVLKIRSNIREKVKTLLDRD